MQNVPKTLLIVRGLPGSGKSTQVEKLVANLKPNYYKICSNDLYPGYYVNGNYEWTPERAKEAVRYCKEQFGDALVRGVELIIIDNTNLNSKSWGHYAKAAKANGYSVQFIEFVPEPTVEYIRMCASRNKHNVKESHLYQMLKAWEPINATNEMQ